MDETTSQPGMNPELRDLLTEAINDEWGEDDPDYRDKVLKTLANTNDGPIDITDAFIEDEISIESNDDHIFTTILFFGLGHYAGLGFCC